MRELTKIAGLKDPTVDRGDELAHAPSVFQKTERQAPKLPPLNLFRVFDAAARHHSFRLAADELCVTPSAVSQQIRQLEDYFGVRLFRRMPRKVELTRDGTILADVVQEALTMLVRGCDRLFDPDASVILCISTSTSLASRWLVGHLRGFMQEHPQIKITLLASNDPVDFKRQDIDVAVRWGKNDWKSDVFAERLTRDYHFPVCSPAYRDEMDLRTPSCLSRATVLHEVHGSAWTTWFNTTDRQSVHFQDVLYFGDAALMLEAAVANQGVCLTNYLLAEKDLTAGRLIAPFESVFDLEDEGYYILTSVDFANKPAIETLRSWLKREASETVNSAILASVGKVPLPGSTDIQDVWSE